MNISKCVQRAKNEVGGGKWRREIVSNLKNTGENKIK